MPNENQQREAKQPLRLDSYELLMLLRKHIQELPDDKVLPCVNLMHNAYELKSIALEKTGELITAEMCEVLEKTDEYIDRIEVVNDIITGVSSINIHYK